MEEMLSTDVSINIKSARQLICSENRIYMDDLSFPMGPIPSMEPHGFSFSAPTCMENMYRVLRALYINKVIKRNEESRVVNSFSQFC